MEPAILTVDRVGDRTVVAIVLPGFLSVVLAVTALGPPSGAPRAVPATRFDDVTARRLERSLPGFVSRSSERFVLVSDLEPGEASRVLATLEATANAVERLAAQLSCATRPLDRPLISLAFREREAFEEHARVVDRIDARWMAGYWLPGAERTVFRAGGPSGASGKIRAGALASAHSADQATVAHEAAHQLLHRLGVQRRSPNQPLWISEGLAMAFEAAPVDGRIEAFAAQPERDQAVRAMILAGRSLPIAALVSTPRLPEREREAIEVFYNQSWSLARFLAERDRGGLASYLASLRSEAGRLTPRRNVELFERVFGPIGEVTASWREWGRHQGGAPREGSAAPRP